MQLSNITHNYIEAMRPMFSITMTIIQVHKVIIKIGFLPSDTTKVQLSSIRHIFIYETNILIVIILIILKSPQTNLLYPPKFCLLPPSQAFKISIIYPKLKVTSIPLRPPNPPFSPSYFFARFIENLTFLGDTPFSVSSIFTSF